jgi:hypothetical protein
MKAYLLTEDVRLQTVGYPVETKERGVTLDKDTAETWKDSKGNRGYHELPVLEATEKTVVDFQEQSETTVA